MMNSPVDKIKERLSIIDVISSYLSIEQSGKNYKARCPFHNEKTPSFFISPDKGSYYCFGCGEKGDIFSFVGKFEGTDFVGSLKILAARAGITLEYKKNDGSADRKETWYQIMEEATRFFESSFAKNPEARGYLLGRGLSDVTIQKFRVGYAQDAWRSLSDHLIKLGFSKEDIESVGLMKKTETGFYDRFRSRIMFPISDSSGRVIAFSGRIFGKPDSEEAKYLNSPDTPLFNKSNVLFGIDKAKTAIRTRGYSIIVEGQMDLLMSHQAGFENTVAVSGTAFSENIEDKESNINNLGLIRRLARNILFAFDGDSAGIRAAGRASMIALSLDMQVKVAVLPEGKDPADIIRENPDIWKDSIKNACNIVSFHIDRICKNTPDIRLRGKQIREIVFPFLSMIQSSIERSAYIKEMYSKTGLPEKAIIEDFNRYEKVNMTQVPDSKNVESHQSENISRRHTREKRMFGVLFWRENSVEHKEVIERILSSFKEAIGNETFEKILSEYEPFRDALAFEAEMWYGGKIDEAVREIEELVLNLEEEILHDRIAILLEDMNAKERNHEKGSVGSVVAEYQKLIGRIQDIKSRRSQ